MENDHLWRQFIEGCDQAFYLLYDQYADKLYKYGIHFSDDKDFITETTHDMLLQKSNGMFELVVWSERVSGSDNVTVNLGRIYRNIKIYDPTIGTSVIQTLNNVSSVTLLMSDHPMIIEI